MSLLYSFPWRRDDIVLQVLVRNGIVQQGDVLRNGDTLVSRHILISQFKTGVQNFLTGSLLDRQRGIVIEYPRYGCRGESSHRGFGQAAPTGPPEIQGSRELVVSEMTNNGSMEMVKETTSYAREFGIGITVSCAGPDSEEYSTRNEASSCLRNVIERNPLDGMRSPGNEGAGPTAIFAFNDLGTINVYRAARQHSISLPEQLSIIGFDDVYPAASMCPSLTTIRQPFDLIARQCIDLILEAREGKVGQNYFILPTQLVERESCASPSLL